MITSLTGDGLYLVFLADVAGVETQTLDPGLDRGESETVLVMDVGDDRNRATRHDLG